MYDLFYKVNLRIELKSNRIFWCWNRKVLFFVVKIGGAEIEERGFQQGYDFMDLYRLY